MRRTVITWSAVFALLFAGFAASVVALNADLYSAHGFVKGYLSALERQDSASALEVPGVQTSNSAATDLLTDAAMGELRDVRVVRDTANEDGTHTVVVEYTMAAPDSDETADTSSSEFVVARDGTRLGLFPTWRFVTSPLNTISVTVQHDTSFDVNGFPVTSTADAGTPGTYLVFAPGRYDLDHESTYLTAATVPLTVSTIGEIADATVDVQANEDFVAEVQKHVSAYLAECTTQQVLMPTGCPFGKPIANITASAPVWTMATEPAVTIVPGVEPGTWAVPKTPAAAHIVIDVKSYFDGTLSTLDEDVPFDVQYALTFEADDRLLITAVYE
jgi:hypothetical protein